MASRRANIPSSEFSPSTGDAVTSTSPRHTRLISELTEAIAIAETRPLTIGEVVGRLHGEGIALVSLVLSLPFLQPLSLGPISILAGSALGMLGWQMVQGRSLPWLPERVERLELSARIWRVLLNTLMKLLSFAGRFARPRMQGLARGQRARRLAGMVIAAGGLLIVAPFPGIPFSNSLPAVAVALIAIAEMEEDGLLVIAALITLAASVLYLGAVGFAAFEILRKMTDWAMGLFGG